MWLFTTKTARPAWDVEFHRGDHLIFGKETRGLPQTILEAHADRLVTLPMLVGERSLNLATAVCAAVYEAIRQMSLRDEIAIDSTGRILPPTPREPKR
jgi:tRNA (cytidine/uridine-2'-O-)-methyltransferase